MQKALDSPFHLLSPLVAGKSLAQVPPPRQATRGAQHGPGARPAAPGAAGKFPEAGLGESPALTALEVRTGSFWLASPGASALR